MTCETLRTEGMMHDYKLCYYSSEFIQKIYTVVHELRCAHIIIYYLDNS